VISYRQALHDTLRAELRRDEKVFLIGEEIGVFEGSYKITAGLLAEFGPRRVRDTPICEEGFTGVAIGAAMMGLRPVVEIMTINFSLLAIDQIVNNAAKLRSLSGGQVSVPLVIRTPGGGGQQLSATHSQNLEVFYAYVPGLKVVAPATCADAKGLLAAAIRDDDPVLVLENLALYNTKGEVPDGEHVAEIGRAAVLKPGRDITVIGYSRAAVIALDVARKLEDDGISAEVIDLRSLRPLDRDTVCASVRKTSRAVIVEDDWLSYGAGAELAATIQEGAFDYLDAPVRRVAAAEVPLPTPSRWNWRPCPTPRRSPGSSARPSGGTDARRAHAPAVGHHGGRCPQPVGQARRRPDQQGRRAGGDRDRQGRHGHGGLRRGRAHPHPGPGGRIGPHRHPDRRHRRGRRRSHRAVAGARSRSGRTSGGSWPGTRTARRGIARRAAARVSAGPQARP
jgi:pyruvate dehydrogenase E1 component beta subunit